MKTAGWSFLFICCGITSIIVLLAEHEIKEHCETASSAVVTNTIVETNYVQQNQWYLRIKKIKVDPHGPNSMTTSIRIVAFVNGQPYGFPSYDMAINGFSNKRESWPIPIGSPFYKISFGGYVIRDQFDHPSLEADTEPIEYSIADFPVTNQSFTMAVSVANGFGDTNLEKTAVNVVYDIIRPQDRSRFETDEKWRQRIPQ